MWLQSLVQENWWLGTPRKRKGKAKKGKNAFTNPLTSVTCLVCMVPSLARDAKLVHGDLHTVRVAKNRSSGLSRRRTPDELVAIPARKSGKYIQKRSLHTHEEITHARYICTLHERHRCLYCLVRVHTKNMLASIKAIKSQIRTYRLAFLVFIRRSINYCSSLSPMSSN